MNPTYSNQDEWLARAVWWAKQGVRSALLVLASTSALYWRPRTFERGTVDLYEGRIAFINPATGLPVDQNGYASALVLLGPGFLPGVVRTRCADSGELIARLPHGHLDLFSGADARGDTSTIAEMKERP